MSAAIGVGLEELAIENELRAYVITDVGRAFCGCADLREIAGDAMRLAEKIATNAPLAAQASSGSTIRATTTAPTGTMK